MLRNKSINIIIDTNLWVSFIISNKLNLLDSLIFLGEIKILFSLELINEIKSTISKPKLKKYFVNNALEEILLKFEPFTELVDVKSNIKICRDAKDNFLLALAQDGNASFLLTGDKDLLDLKKYGKTKIITISKFLELNKT